MRTSRASAPLVSRFSELDLPPSRVERTEYHGALRPHAEKRRRVAVSALHFDIEEPANIVLTTLQDLDTALARRAKQGNVLALHLVVEDRN